ncbi:hypothetical protein [Bosea sp. 117]|uniref:hypothetical protein n=1 Tax=Bosea sp. 117 TaxID=1125973 RepID=UPI000493F236|nr:hypothetical protein [Bosea sp. 117]
MRTVLLALPLALMASAASAQPMPNSLSMSCAGARDLVSRSGAIVIGTGPHLFDRYVTNTSYCSITQVTEPAWVATADDPQCLIGKLCKDRRYNKRNR